ncbi:hypothetical protein EDD18DRAFT_1362823 [Armillaria luteobubalina]|uniref:Uncharacterized protein n=1 Tax=Armillaria luteobubalina TaxID=153913 RepID=A0AA39UGW4_9AGAR|nr:hypothetical protein EDD18DRAFT_1362823 [Armillaria luteobubalina]
MNIYLLVGYALPTDPLTDLNGPPPEGIKHSKRTLPVLKIDYKIYPQSAENICYSWHCMNGPREVAPDRAAPEGNQMSLQGVYLEVTMPDPVHSGAISPT